MLFNQTNNGNSMMSNKMSTMPQMNGMIDQHRNMNNMANNHSSMSSNMQNTARNIAGISKMPKIEDRFKNVKIDRNPARQIMNSSGQNVIQNKIRGVKDISAN